MAPTGRPVVQAIKGVAAHYQKQPVLLTLAGTTEQVARFADEAGVAVFRFDLLGVPVARNAPARLLQQRGKHAKAAALIPVRSPDTPLPLGRRLRARWDVSLDLRR